MVLVLMAMGFEEIEAISIIDILRRADIEVVTAGLDRTTVTGAHGVHIIADVLLDDINEEEFEMVVLPGGLPGAEHLAKSEKVQNLLAKFDANNKQIAAICAAPWALQTAGVLKDKYTCYPSFEKTIREKGYIDSENVVIDHNIITSRGPATAMEFALNLVKELKGEDKFKEIKSALLA